MLSENDACMPLRSLSIEKGDIDNPNQPTKGRGGAGAPSDKYDLMPPL